MFQSQLSTRLLVVADKPAAREELASALASVTSAHTLEAASPAAAMAELQALDQRIDLAVIDMEMSGSGAVTLTRKIREPQTLGPQNIAILLIGGAAGSSPHRALARLGIQGHLLRPFTSEQLRVAIRAALAASSMVPIVHHAAMFAEQPVGTTPQPIAAPASHETTPVAVPFANKPFRHGLQSLMRARPLTADEAFGFEPAPISVRPRPMRVEPESPPAMGQLRVAVA